jgi:hypothetical protein
MTNKRSKMTSDDALSVLTTTELKGFARQSFLLKLLTSQIVLFGSFVVVLT